MYILSINKNIWVYLRACKLVPEWEKALENLQAIGNGTTGQQSSGHFAAHE